MPHKSSEDQAPAAVDVVAEQQRDICEVPGVGMTAPADTKRGYGLWRGEVIHPADPRLDSIIASGDPVTDTKGLGLRYIPVRGEKVVPHFRVHDPEKFSAALDRVFPVIHDAVVRIVAEDVQEGGFDALLRWCAGDSLPKPFEVANIAVEGRYNENNVTYRPDVTVLHPEGGRIELEVVNTHAPEAKRLDAAWGAGHIVLSLRIRDLVEDIVFSEGRGAVPEDATLRDMLRGRRFRLCGRERVPEAVRVVWRDLNLSAYAMGLRESLRDAYREDVREVQDPLSEILNGITSGDLDPRVRRVEVFRNLHDSFRVMEKVDVPDSYDWLMFRDRAAQASLPCPKLASSSEQAERFLDQFDRSPYEPAGVRRLRYAVASVWYLRKACLQICAINASQILGMKGSPETEFGVPPLTATEQGIF